MNDYSIFYRQELTLDEVSRESGKWELFLSAFTSAQRVQDVFAASRSRNRRWVAFAEYGYQAQECPPGTIICQGRDEAATVGDIFAMAGYDRGSLCVDITGFIRPYLLYLLYWLKCNGVTRFEALYSEPRRYSHGEKTQFSDEEVREVRPVYGYEGNHDPETSRDLLIIGAGYESELISQIAESKESARKVQIFGFPPLRADMYQENVLRAHHAAEAVGRDAYQEFAPANDPFVTANVIQGIVHKLGGSQGITNLYLSPLATKPQVLGFGLYYLTEWLDRPASVIFPFCNRYARETSEGLARLWKYTVELA